MRKDDYWQIFKNTGSLEAYLAYTQLKEDLEKDNALDDKNKGNTSENKGYTG